MVIFFSGTGNSEYCARYIAKLIDDEVVDSAQYIRKKQIAQLEKQVDEKMRRINSFNSRESYNRVNTVDANELERQLDKYRK